jgi:hypothetical protein
MSESILNVAKSSNVNISGRWVFRVDQQAVRIPDCFYEQGLLQLTSVITSHGANYRVGLQLISQSITLYFSSMYPSTKVAIFYSDAYIEEKHRFTSLADYR